MPARDYAQGKLSDFPARIPSLNPLWGLDNGHHGKVAVMARQDIPFQAIHLQMTL